MPTAVRTYMLADGRTVGFAPWRNNPYGYVVVKQARSVVPKALPQCVEVSPADIFWLANMASLAQNIKARGMTIHTAAVVVVTLTELSKCPPQLPPSPSVVQVFIGQVPFDVSDETLRRGLILATNAAIHRCDMLRRSGTAHVWVAECDAERLLSFSKQLIFAPCGLMQINDAETFAMWMQARDELLLEAQHAQADGMPQTRTGLKPLVIEAAMSPARDPRRDQAA